jgi:hypothetical protein
MVITVTDHFPVALLRCSVYLAPSEATFGGDDATSLPFIFS